MRTKVIIVLGKTSAGGDRGQNHFNSVNTKVLSTWGENGAGEGERVTSENWFKKPVRAKR